MFDAIILLAGKGIRSGLPYNKVLYKLKNKPLFRYALEEFLKAEACKKVVLVCAKGEIGLVKEMVSDLSGLEFAEGGEFRQDSVRAGMALCTSDLVLIHDGARPFISKDEIEKVYLAALRSKAAVLAVRPTDTIVEVKEGYRTLERNNLWRVLTPQGVDRKLYLEAARLASAEGYYGTDDVSLLAKYLRVRPEIIPGSNKNIKITTDQDILFLEYLNRRQI